MQELLTEDQMKEHRNLPADMRGHLAEIWIPLLAQEECPILMLLWLVVVTLEMRLLEIAMVALVQGQAEIIISVEGTGGIIPGMHLHHHHPEIWT
jgi:hypothetical protein